ncbi:MAG: NAD-dependent succinate-semialdehyde dehydrogenase, partial [Myxococcota bacterium]
LFRHDAFVAGEWHGGDRRVPVTDPATGETMAEVTRCAPADAERAIAAAHDAAPPLKASLAGDRATVLHRFADLMAEHTADLALLLTSEQGKPLAEARGEIAYAAAFLRWFAEEARRAYGDVIPPTKSDQRLLVLREPVGVAAAITPWNFPSAMITRKLGAAYAAGCPLVLKPAEATPLSALALRVLATRAGMEPGAFQVLTGDASDAAPLGKVLTGSPLVRKLSFTGSTEVGKILLRQCAETVKKVSLELGGNAPFLVFEDADVDAAVEGCLVAKMRNGGQTCVAANRILVHAAVHDAFVEKLAARMGAMKVGPGVDEGVAVGPLVDEPTFAKVRAHVADALELGAETVLGGGPHALGRTFHEPTVLTGVGGEMLMTREETFGPVAGIQKFTEEDEAIAIANDTRAGLIAYFYARDVGRVWRVAEALEAGMVGVNTGLVSNTVAPFGGVKESGLGREGSQHGLEDWTELKYVAIGL